MANFSELKKAVKKKGFGSSLYSHVNGEPVYLSRGIREAYCTEDHIQTIIDLVGRFQKGDFGDARNHGKEERDGHEYGRYDLKDMEADPGDDSAVWVHRAEHTVLVYFRFER